MKVAARITQEDIDQGNPDDPVENPVGLAILRLLRPVPETTLAGQDRIWFEPGKLLINIAFEFEGDEDEIGAMSYHEVELPQEVDRFLDRFDEHGAGSVEPFVFELDIPDEELVE